MSKSLIIDLACLPEEGEVVSGELSKDLFDLPAGDAVPLGPLQYDLMVQRFDSELLLTGFLEATFEFICVRTLHPFAQTLRLDAAAVSLEIENSGEIDVAGALREEVLLHFPVDPRCEEGDDPQKCEIDSRYLSVDKPADDGLTTPPRPEGDDRWSTLDDIKDLKDQL